MENKDFSTTIMVEQSPKQVFDAVTNVRGWWSQNIEGGTAKLNDVFTYEVKDLHRCKMQLTEVIPNQKVVWDVLENYFSFTTDKTEEWVGNKIIFEITGQDVQTELKFTQQGLTPAYECYQICFDAWTSYITGSLKNLITTGEGQPNSKEC